MIARRQFIQSVLSTWVILSLPETVLAGLSESRLTLTRAPLKTMLPLIEEGMTKIKVIGVGDGGCQTVEHMNDHQLPDVEYICVNTDAQALYQSPAHKTIMLGTSGLGTGGRPDLGHQAAIHAEEEIRAALTGTHMLFIIAGLGGGTGSGAAPVIARIAKSMDMLTVGVVMTPFKFEGNSRFKKAEAGLAELKAHVDSVIVLPNEKLLNKFGNDVSQVEAFDYMNDLIKEAVCGMAEIIQVQGHVAVDFEDVQTILREPGKARTATAVANGPDRARYAAEQAVTNIRLDGFDLSAANGVLVLISATKGTLKLSDSKLAINMVRQYVTPDAHLIYGTFYDESLNGKIRVTVVATGLHIVAGMVAG